MKPKDKPQRKVVIRYKGKNNNNSTEHLKTESQKDLNKCLLRETKNKNMIQDSLYNLDCYKDFQTEDNRKTLMPNKIHKNQVNNTTLRRKLFVKNNEKEKEKEKQIT